MNITVVGTGYVGLANAITLTKVATITAIDIDNKRVNLVNSGKSPIQEVAVIETLSKTDVSDKLFATTGTTSYKDADFIFIATPTNYDPDQNFFDTSSVEQVLRDIHASNSKAIVVIRSTIPVGFTKKMSDRYKDLSITFAPEFLREGQALQDALNPSRIVIGGSKETAKKVRDLLLSITESKNTPTLLTGTNESEAIKLFANTYLAMRVAFFNELDTYSEHHNLVSSDIIQGVSLDPRIGNFYNNPSFGYGGYCLPKDTKQLLANYRDIPNDLMGAIITANKTRKSHIVEMIRKKNPSRVGIYRLTMKTGSDNFRDSAILDIITALKNAKIPLYIFEPSIKQDVFMDIPIKQDLALFASSVDLILANRYTEELDQWKSKTYTRDLFRNN